MFPNFEDDFESKVVSLSNITQDFFQEVIEHQIF